MRKKKLLGIMIVTILLLTFVPSMAMADIATVATEDIVYLGGANGDDANVGNVEDKPLKSLQAAMGIVKADGKIVLVGDAQVVKIDNDYANEAWTNITNDLTVEGNGYKLINNSYNSYRDLYVTGATLTLNNVVLDVKEGHKTLNFIGKTGANITFKNCSGPFATIKSFDKVVLDGSKLNAATLETSNDNVSSIKNLELNNGSDLYAKFSVTNLSSTGASSKIYSRYGYYSKVSGAFSADNKMNVEIENFVVSNFKNGANILDFSSKNIEDTMCNNFAVSAETASPGDLTVSIYNKRYLRAKFSNYTITFDANGGWITSSSVVTTTGNVDTSGKLSSLPTPTRQGYDFNGWYDAQTDGNKITTETVFIASTTVYAHWLPKQYDVIFDGNYTSSNYSVIKTQTYGNQFVLPEQEPTRTAYKFAGWYTEKNGGTEITEDNLFIITSSITLYAKWIPKEVWNPTVDKQTYEYTGIMQEYKLDDYGITYLQNEQPVTPINVGVYDVMITRNETDTHAAYSETFVGKLEIVPADSVVTPNISENETEFTYG